MKKYLITIIAFLFLPGLCFAGSLTSDWDTTMTNLSNGYVFVKGTHDLGTIDMAGKYVAEIHVNIKETGENPSGEAGVSIFISGATDGVVPAIVWTVDATTYQDYGDGTTGVTKVFPIENVRYITIGVGQSGTDAFNASVNYYLMQGKYTD